VFVAMAEQLNTPAVLHCPVDTYHAQPSTGFGGVVSSYFVNGDAKEAYPELIVSGDVNIGSVPAANNSPADFAFIATAAAPGAASTSVAMVFPPATTGSWAWTSDETHKKSGNLLYADGHVDQVNVIGLQTAIISSTNRVCPQAWNFPK